MKIQYLPRACLRTAAVVGAVFIALTPLGTAADGSTDVVVRAGDPTPIPGIDYGSFSSIVQLNDAGQVAYWSSLTGTGVDLTNNEALWRDSALIAREGNPTSIGGGVNYGFLDSFSAQLNNIGQVAYWSGLTGTGVTGSNDRAVWRDGILIARQDSPTIISGVNYDGLSSRVRLNDIGQVAYSSTLTGTGVNTTNDNAVWRDSALIAREGNPTSIGGGVNYGFLISGSVQLNDAGQVAYWSALTGTGVTSSNNTAVWRDSALIARQDSPTTISGVNYGGLDSSSVQLNDTGQVAYWSSLTGTGVTDSNNSAIWRDSTLVAREGNPTSIGGGVNYGFLSSSSVRLNDIGQVAYLSGLTGTGVTSSNGTAIWRDSTLIARVGNPTPIGGDINYGVFDGSIMQFNDTGQVAYWSTLTGTGVTFDNDRAIFIGDGIESLPVIREGDSLASSTVSDLSRFSLNTHAQLAYWAQFTDGSSGIFLFTPDVHWRQNFSSSWDISSRWTLGIDPAEVHDVFIDPSVSLTVTGPAGNETVKSLTIGGGAGIGTLRLRGGNLTPLSGTTVLPTGVLTGDGVITGDVHNQGTVTADNVTITEALFNSGVVNGSGRINAFLHNAIGGEVRVGAGDSMRLTGPGTLNSGRIEVIEGEIEFDQPITNQALTGNIVGRDATLRFSGGLNNQGSLGLAFGINDVFGDIINEGSVVLSGGGNAVFYDDYLNITTTQVSAGSAAVFFGAVTGAGAFTGTGTLFFEGDLAPGSSPGLVSMAGDVVLGPGSTTVMEIGGLIRGIEYDAIDVGGTLSLGGTLDVDFLDLGSGLFNPKVNDFFDLFMADTIAGSFATLLLPALDPWLFWDFQILPDFSGSMDVARLSTPAVPLPPAVWLFVSALIALYGIGRRRRAAA